MRSVLQTFDRGKFDTLHSHSPPPRRTKIANAGHGGKPIEQCRGVDQELATAWDDRQIADLVYDEQCGAVETSGCVRGGIPSRSALATGSLTYGDKTRYCKDDWDNRSFVVMEKLNLSKRQRDFPHRVPVGERYARLHPARPHPGAAAGQVRQRLLRLEPQRPEHQRCQRHRLPDADGDAAGPEPAFPSAPGTPSRPRDVDPLLHKCQLGAQVARLRILALLGCNSPCCSRRGCVLDYGRNEHRAGFSG